MTFVSKGASIFNSQDKTFPDCTPPKLKRSDGRLKKFDSILDDRVWSNDERERNRYLYDLVNGSQTCLIPSSCFKYIPLEELIKLLLAERDAYIKELEQRLGILEEAGPSNGQHPEKSKAGKPVEEIYKNGKFVDPEDQDMLGMKDKIAKMKAELEECKSARDTLREAMHKLENIDEIVNENKSLKAKLKCSDEMIKSLKENKQKLEKELENLRTKSQIQMDLDEAQEMLRNGDQLAEERNHLRQRVEELQLELNQARTKQSEMELLKKQSESASLSLKEMARENQCYKKKLASMKDLEKQIEELKKRANEMVDKYKKDSMKANNLNKQLKDLCRELKMLREERDRLRRRVNELACYEQQYNSLQCKLRQVDSILEENAKLNSKLASLNKLELENELLKCQLEQCQVSEIEAEESKEKITELENAVADQEEEMKDLLCQIERLTRTYGDNSELDRLKQELCKKEFKLKLCEEQLSEIPLLEAEIDELRWKLENCYQNITGNPPQSGNEIPKFSQRKARLICSKYEEPVAQERRQVICSDIQTEMTQFLEKTDQEKRMSPAEIQELLQTSKGIISCLMEDMIDRQKEMEELANCNREMSEEIAMLKAMIGNPDMANFVREISELKKLLCEKEKKICCLEQKICCLEKKIAKSGDLGNVNKNIECLEAEIEYLKYLNKQMRADLREACCEIERCAELERLREEEQTPHSQAGVVGRPGESRTKSQKDEYNIEAKGSSNDVDDFSDQDELRQKGPAKKQREEGARGQKDGDNISDESDYGQKLENLDDVDDLKAELKRLKEQNRQLKNLVKYYEERLDLEKTSNEAYDSKAGKPEDQKDTFKKDYPQTDDVNDLLRKLKQCEKMYQEKSDDFDRLFEKFQEIGGTEEFPKSEEKDFTKDSVQEEERRESEAQKKPKLQSPEKDSEYEEDRSEADSLEKPKQVRYGKEPSPKKGRSETDALPKQKEQGPDEKPEPKKDRAEADALQKPKPQSPRKDSDYEDERSEQQKPKSPTPDKEPDPKKDRTEADAPQKPKSQTPRKDSGSEEDKSETVSKQKPKSPTPGKEPGPEKDETEGDALQKPKSQSPRKESDYEDGKSEQQKPKTPTPGKEPGPEKDKTEADAPQKPKQEGPRKDSDYEEGKSEQQKPKSPTPGKEPDPKKDKTEADAPQKPKQEGPRKDSDYEEGKSEQQKPKSPTPGKEPDPKKDKTEADAPQKPKQEGPRKDSDYEDGKSEQQKPKSATPGKEPDPKKDKTEADALQKPKSQTPRKESDHEEERSVPVAQQKPKSTAPDKEPGPKKDKTEADALQKPKPQGPRKDSSYEDKRSESGVLQKPKSPTPGKEPGSKKDRSEEDAPQKPKQEGPRKEPGPDQGKTAADVLQKPKLQSPGKDPDYEKDKKAIESAIQNVEDEVDGLSVKLEEKQKLLKKQEDMAAELEKLRKELKACKEREERGSGKGQEDTLLDEMVGLREQAEQAKSENKKLKDDLEKMRKLLEQYKKSQLNEGAQASLMSSKHEGMSYPFQPAPKAVPQTVIPIREKQKASMLERGRQEKMQKPGRASIIKATPNESVKVVLDGKPVEQAAAQPRLKDRASEGGSVSDESVVSFSDLDPEFKNFLCSLNPYDHKENIYQIEKRYREMMAVLQAKNDQKLKNLINQHKKESAMRDRNFNESLTSMRTGYESDIRKLVEKHKGSILRLQNLHEDEVRELNENYERQLNAIQSQNDSVMNDLTTGVANKFKSLAEQHNRDLKELETKYQKLLGKKEQEYANLMGGVDSTGSSYDRELKRLKKSNQKRINIMEQKYEKLILCERKKYERQLEETIKKLKEGKGVSHGVCQCRFPDWNAKDTNAPLEFNEILQKILTLGLESLSFNEVALVHKRTCAATNEIILNPEAKPVLLPGIAKEDDQSIKNNKEELLNRILVLENEISMKQRETQDAILNMESAVKAERKRLHELKDSLRNEREMNSGLKAQMARSSVPAALLPSFQMESGRKCSVEYEDSPRPKMMDQMHNMSPINIGNIIPGSRLIRKSEIDVQCVMEKIKELEKLKCICPQVAPEKDTAKTNPIKGTGVQSAKDSHPKHRVTKMPKKSGKK